MTAVEAINQEIEDTGNRMSSLIEGLKYSESLEVLDLCGIIEAIERVKSFVASHKVKSITDKF